MIGRENIALIGFILVNIFFSLMILPKNVLKTDIVFFLPVYLIIVLNSTILFLTLPQKSIAPPIMQLSVTLFIELTKCLFLWLSVYLYLKRPGFWLAPLWVKKTGLALSMGVQFAQIALNIWQKNTLPKLNSRQYVLLTDERMIPLFWGFGIYRWIRYPDILPLFFYPLGIMVYFNTLWPLMLYVPFATFLFLWIQFQERQLGPDLNEEMKEVREKSWHLIPFYY